MREEFKDIVNLILRDSKNHLHFESEHFVYWFTDCRYYYAGDKVSRDEFQYIKQYAAYSGTLPSIERENRLMMDKAKDDSQQVHHSIDYSHPAYSTNTYSYEKIIRYSKTYDSLEYYNVDTRVKAPIKPNGMKRVIVMTKKNKYFTINSNGYARVLGNRWLSLKNISKFISLSTFEINESVAKIMFKLMVGKDWVIDLKTNNNIYISNSSVRQANSLEHAIELECGARPVNIIKKAFNNNTNSIVNFYKLIKPSKVHEITNFIKNNWSILRGILFGDDGYDLDEYDLDVKLLFLYFLCKDNRVEYSILKDYLNMLLQSGEKINLDISSYSTIKRKHDELSRDILMNIPKKNSRLRVGKVFPDIKSTSKIDIEKIKTVDRLNMESKILHHCVHSYKDKVNSGQCAIYSLCYDGRRYTMEIEAKKKKDNNEEYELSIIQIKGNFNCSPPISMIRVLEEMFDNNKIPPMNIKHIHFQDNVRNKKVIQIGSSILSRVNTHLDVNREYEQVDESNSAIQRSDESLRAIQYEELPF